MSDKKGVILDRFRKLIDESEFVRDEISKNIGCDTSTITKHYNGDRTITAEFVIKYAKFFNVSADYLLGLSDTPTTDLELKAVCDFTGFSEEFINFLKEPHLEELKFLEILNSPVFHSFLFEFSQEYHSYSITLEEYQEYQEYQLEKRSFTKESHVEDFILKERFENFPRWEYYEKKDLYLYRTMKAAERLLLGLNRDTQDMIDKTGKEIEEIR